MNLGDIPQLMGPMLFLQLAGGALGLVCAIAIAVRVVQRRPTHGAVLALPLLLPALLTLGSAVMGLGGVEGDAVHGMALNLGSRLLGWLWLWPAAFIVLTGSAIAGVRSQEKQPVMAGVALALTALVVALPWGYGWPEEDYVLVGIRTGLYLGAGLLMAVAFLGRGAKGEGYDPAIAASSAFALFIAGGELFQRGLSFVGLAKVVTSREDPEAYVQGAMEAIIDKFSPWDHFTAFAALIPLVLAIVLAARDEDARLRGLTAVVALAAPALYLVGDPGMDALLALSAATH